MNLFCFKVNVQGKYARKRNSKDIENAFELYADRKDWKFRLKQEINRLGLEKVINKLKEYGGRKTIKVHNIKYWLYPKSLRTDDQRDIFCNYEIMWFIQ